MRKRLVIASCVATLIVVTPAAAMPRYGDWSEGTFLSTVNTSELEFANAISRDELHLYFQRGDAAVGGEDLWVSHRESRSAPWGAAQKLPATVNSADNDRAAAISPDGHWLFFGSDRPGGRGLTDLYVSWRVDVHDDSSWHAAVNLDDLGTPVNTAGFDSGPAIYRNDDAGTTELYFVSNPTGAQAFADVYVSVQNPDGSFGVPSAVTALSSAASEGRPYIRRDGLEIYFQSNRVGGKGAFDIWLSTRTSTDAAWSTPQNVEELNTTGVEVTPVLSWDALTLYFAVVRPGQVGEILAAMRERASGKP